MICIFIFPPDSNLVVEVSIYIQTENRRAV